MEICPAFFLQVGFAILALFYKFKSSPFLSKLGEAAKEKHRQLIFTAVPEENMDLLNLLMSRDKEDLDEILNCPTSDGETVREEQRNLFCLD